MAVYSDGESTDVTSRAAWTSSDESILARRANSEFRGLEEGTAMVTATFEEATGSASVTVTPSPLVDLEISPTMVTIEVNGSEQFSALGTFATGASLDVADMIDWRSSDPTIATVVAGRVTGVSPGTTTVIGSRGEVMASASVTVSEPRTVGLEIRGPPGLLPAGQARILVAEATLSSGSTVAVTAEVQWSSSAPAVASVGNDADTAGVVTGLSEGQAVITARDPATGLEAIRSITVSPKVLERIQVSPETAEVSAGEFVFFAALGIFSDGSQENLTRRMQWESSNPGVARADTDIVLRGRVVALAEGTANISVTDEETGLTSDASGGSAVITVGAAQLRTIQIEPRSMASTPAGRTFQFSAIGNFSDGTTQDLTNSVQWSAAPAAVATVDSAGLASGLVEGTATISAFEPQTGVASGMLSAELTVTEAVLEQVRIEPQTIVLAFDQVRQVDAIGSFSDGSTSSVRDRVVWSSSNTQVFGAGPTGILRGVAAGTATVAVDDVATNLRATASVRVEPLRLISLDFVPARVTLPPGGEVAYALEASFNNATVENRTATATITNTNTGVAERGFGGNRQDRIFALQAGSATLSSTDPTTQIGAQMNVVVSSTITLNSLSVSAPSPIVPIGVSEQLRALGTYSNGEVYDLTHAVTWSLSRPGFATISNQPTSAGIITGVVTGSVSVSVTRGVVSSPPLGLSVLVPEFTGAWNGPTQSVDGTGGTRVDVGSVSVPSTLFGSSATVTRVRISIDFLKTDGSCGAPLSGSAFHGETVFALRSPNGTVVSLAPGGTWSGDVAISPVTVTFEDTAAAAPSGTPVSGTFRPASPLSGFNGQRPSGTWTLEAGDTAAGDPLCVNSYEITVTAR